MVMQSPCKRLKWVRFLLGAPVLSGVGSLVDPRVWNAMHAGSIPVRLTKFCGCDGIGIRIGLRSQVLRVRVSPSAPKFAPIVYGLGSGSFKPTNRVRVSVGAPKFEPCDCWCGQEAFTLRRWDRHPYGSPHC